MVKETSKNMVGLLMLLKMQELGILEKVLKISWYYFHLILKVCIVMKKYLEWVVLRIVGKWS